MRYPRRLPHLSFPSTISVTVLSVCAALMWAAPGVAGIGRGADPDPACAERGDEKCEARSSILRNWTNAWQTTAQPGTALSADGSTLFVAFVDETSSVNASTGAVRWAQRLLVPWSWADVAVAPDGGSVYATGTDASPDEEGPRERIGTIAYGTASGVIEWRATYSGPEGHALGSRVAVSPDGDTVYVAGRSREAGAPAKVEMNDLVLVAYDAETGAERWTRRYDASGDASGAIGYPANDRLVDLHVAPDGSAILMTGVATSKVPDPPYGPRTVYNLETVGVDAASGAVLWSAADIPLLAPFAASAVQRGALLVAGTAAEADGKHSDISVSGRSVATGELLWGTRYGQANNWEIVKTMAAPEDGRVFVGGRVAPPDNPESIVTGDASRSAPLVVSIRAADGSVEWSWLPNPVALSIPPDETGQDWQGMHEVLDLSTTPGGGTVYALTRAVASRTASADLQRPRTEYSELQTVALNGSSGGRLWGAQYSDWQRQSPKLYAVSGVTAMDGTLHAVTYGSALCLTYPCGQGALMPTENHEQMLLSASYAP